MNRLAIIALSIIVVTFTGCGGGSGAGGPPPPVLSTNANLGSLTMSGTTLGQSFDATQTEYTSLVGFLVTSVRVEVSAADSAATLTVNGTAADSGGATVSLGQGDSVITVQATAEDGTTTKTYTVTVSRQAVTAFAQEAYIKASNTEAGDGFGSSVALSENTLAVGAPGEDSATTGVNGDQGDNRGSRSGAVYVFTRGLDGMWSQQAYVKSSNPDAGDGFGSSLALSGDTLIVGAPMEDSASTGVNGDQGNNGAAENSGAVYVFVRDAGGNWSQQSYIKASNTDSGDWFGHSVALSGDVLAVSAWFEDSAASAIGGDQGNSNDALDSGAVYVFARDGTGVWSQQAYVKASNSDASDRFGGSVALTEELLVVGAAGESSWATGIDGDQTNNGSPYSGAVYVLAHDGAGTWSQQAYLKASNPDSGDGFGASVSISGDTLAVGAAGESSAATGVNGDQGGNQVRDAGAAYVFARDIGGTWSQQAYVKASNPGEQVYFGSAVAVFGNALVVSAPTERSIATGIGGDQNDNSAFEAGAAFLFMRDDSGIWTQKSYIKGSNTSGELGFVDEDGDHFGSAIAAFGDTFVIGGFDDSDATGVNGDQVNKNADRSGAVYSFGGPPGRNSNLASIDLNGLDLDQIFQPTQANYTAGVGFLVTTVHLNTQTEGSAAAVYVDGIRIGPAGINVSLAMGSNTIEIEVVASDGITTSFYTLTITRESAAHFAQMAYIKASNTESTDAFGFSVAIDDNTLAIGAPLEDSSSVNVNGDQSDNRAPEKGAVYVFQREAGTPWTQTAYIKTGDASSNTRFGHSISLSEGVLAVGAPKQDGGVRDSGAVFIFEPNDSGFWQQRAYIKLSNADVNDWFGYSVALSGDTLAVGARHWDSNVTLNDGAAYTFVRNSTGTWERQAIIRASNANVSDSFGSSVALSGDLLAVGARDEDSAATGINGDQDDNSAGASGAIYVFARSREGDWQQEAYIKASNTETGDLFGHAVSLSGDTLAVGATHEKSAFSGVNTEQDDNAAENAGAVYVFVRDTIGGWTQQAYIKASNTDAWDLFGYSVVLDGDTLAVGARDEKSIATGIGGDQFNDNASRSGAAYVFARDAVGSWSQKAYIKASNAEAGDQLGVSVALSDGVLAIGAPAESSATKGIDGDQSDNSAVFSGAVYVFE